MKIIRRSVVTGIVREMDLDVTEEQLHLWSEGALIQDVMPHLSPSEREFIITGTVDREWDALWEVASEVEFSSGEHEANGILSL